MVSRHVTSIIYLTLVPFRGSAQSAQIESYETIRSELYSNAVHIRRLAVQKSSNKISML